MASFRPYFTPMTNVQKRTNDLLDVARMAETAVIWLALKEKKIVGFIAIELDIVQPEFSSTSAHIKRLCVDPAYRRQGIATSLIRQALQLAEKSGKTSVILRTAENMIEAQRTYEKVGFKRVPDFDFSYPDLRLLAYLYTPMN